MMDRRRKSDGLLLSGKSYMIPFDSEVRMKNVIIRNERAEDYKEVEELTRKAFYNLYIPGCIEHYLVHTMRSHKDFIPELDFVLELDGKIIGNIMYTRAMLTDENRRRKSLLSVLYASILLIREWDMENS